MITSRRLARSTRGSVLAEYFILLAALSIPLSIALRNFSEDGIQPLFAIPDVFPETITVPPGDPTNGPNGDPDNEPEFPPTLVGGAWNPVDPGSPGFTTGSPGFTTGSPGTPGAALPLCAPPGASWNGSAWEVPGEVFGVIPPPKHNAYPLWVPLSPPQTSTLSDSASFKQFWYPEYQGKHVFFFLLWDYYGDEVIIPPGAVQPPSATCATPPAP